jgi:hypothetical protein
VDAEEEPPDAEERERLPDLTPWVGGHPVRLTRASGGRRPAWLPAKRTSPS